MSTKSTIALNIKQNKEDFELDSLDLQPLIFRYGYLFKTLNPFKENPKDIKNYRTVIITCLFKNYK